MATKVTMYEAKDGSLHKTPSACDAKNVELRLAPAIEKFVDGLGADTAGLTAAPTGELESGGPGYYIELINLPQFLLSQSESLRKVLNDALVVKKPRKGAAKAAAAAAPAQTQPKAPVATVAETPVANVTSTDDLDAALASLA